MAFDVQLLNEGMTRRITMPIRPCKIMKVRERNVDFGLGKNGVLKRVMANRFKKHDYTHIQLRGEVRPASMSKAIFNQVIVWID
jgi:hypothetical protein